MRKREDVAFQNVIAQALGMIPVQPGTSHVQYAGFAQTSALTLSSLPVPILLIAVLLFSAHDKIRLPRLSRH